MSFLYGYCISGTVPVRTSASDASEMDTQLLLGECFEVLSIEDRWLRVRTIHDKVEGWVNRNQTRFLQEDEFNNWINDSQKERSPYRSFLAKSDIEAIMVPFGAEVIFDDVTVTLPHGVYEVSSPPVLMKQLDLLSTAEQFLGIPYLWGGRTDTGVDCSGFVQIVYNMFGFNPPRNSSQQVIIEGYKDTIHDAEVGDLIYFGESKEKITHVGFYLGDGTVLHASGYVKLNNLIFEKRFENPYPFDKKLAEKIQYVQNSNALKIQL